MQYPSGISRSSQLRLTGAPDLADRSHASVIFVTAAVVRAQTELAEEPSATSKK